ncbi:MAG: esterase/lipase family protein [Promethearchaeota archaeon]
MKKRYVRNLSILLILIIPLVSAGLYDPVPRISIWIVNADNSDENTNLAVQTLLRETTEAGVNTRETALATLESIPLYINFLILVGHGTPDGLQASGTIVPWSKIYDAIAERHPEKTIVLACNSPSDTSSNVFGFEGRVDAEAGAIMIGWYLNQIILPDNEMDFPFDRMAKAQTDMQHPLGRYLYFVHGYWGTDDSFSLLRDYLRDFEFFKTDYDENNVKYFDYFAYYGATNESEKNNVHWQYSISDFANNFYNELLGLPAGSQVNIIGHSLGGIITREMLRLHRTDLDAAEISIGKAITLGTPHQGTKLADPLNNWANILSLIGGYLFTGHLWPSPVFWSVTPLSLFMLTLNWDPMSYSSDIEWYTISGYDAIPSALMFVLHGDISDPIVATGRAHLSFAEQGYFNVGHNTLVYDTEGTTYETVSNWITEGLDSDGDGLTDDSEIYFHGTDPNDPDSDNDNLSDYDEVTREEGPTNPNYWDSDGDGIGDGYEVEMEYDPLNPSSPVPASLLISSVTVVDSTRTVNVYVNHYSAMEYVKFYVQYKTKTGSWTYPYFMGIDDSPTTGGDYHKTWTHPTGYIQMKVMVAAYDSNDHWLGSDNHICSISYGSGGGGGGDPPPID